MSNTLDNNNALTAAASRAFFRSVYTYMFGALGISGIIAYTAGNENFINAYFKTQEGGIAPLFWVVVFAPVGLGLLIQMAYNKLSLGLLTLLNNLDKIFTGTTTVGSLFDKIFSAFQTKTGVDLVGQATAGTLVVASEVAVQEAGTAVISNLGTLNFTGDVNVTGTGTTATVDILGFSGNENWTTDTVNSVTEIVDVSGVGIERFTTIVFDRPTGDKISLEITWP